MLNLLKLSKKYRTKLFRIVEVIFSKFLEFVYALTMKRLRSLDEFANFFVPFLTALTTFGSVATFVTAFLAGATGIIGSAAAATVIKKGKPVTTEFAWITDIEITDKNAEKLARAGRNRWKIENHQKRWQGDIEHACSFHKRAQKNHSLMEQIFDFMKQLYEYFFLKKNEIQKTQIKFTFQCCEFQPEIVPKYCRDISGIEEKVISLYARGLSTRDIGTELS